MSETKQHVLSIGYFGHRCEASCSCGIGPVGWMNQADCERWHQHHIESLGYPPASVLKETPPQMETRRCGDCQHHKRLFDGSICTKLLMSVLPSMVPYVPLGKTCFEPLPAPATASERTEPITPDRIDTLIAWMTGQNWTDPADAVEARIDRDIVAALRELKALRQPKPGTPQDIPEPLTENVLEALVAGIKIRGSTFERATLAALVTRYRYLERAQATASGELRA